MSKIVSTAQMREIDLKTIQCGIPSLVLMENAAHRVVELIRRKSGSLKGLRIGVVCGKGNNGGDGMAIARILQVADQAQVDLFLLPDPATLQGDAAAQWSMWRALGGHSTPLETLRGYRLIVDALFGTGFTGEPRPQFAHAIQLINEAATWGTKIVAVDLPSGLSTESGPLPKLFVHADWTVTFTAWKESQALPPLCHQQGELSLAQIGTASALLSDVRWQLTSEADIAPLLAPRPNDSHKGQFGHVLVVAGSRAMTGAAVMTTLAALRVGAGLVTVATTESAASVIRQAIPEAMVHPLPETSSGTIAFEALPRIQELLAARDLLVVGPGLGSDPSTATLVQQLYQSTEQPAVFDADGLNAIAPLSISAAGPRILTPHPGEMSRLVDGPITDRVAIAETFARQHQVTLLLKGDRTLIASPDGDLWINPTGTPAMAKAGSGDILTGLIAGLWAQHLPGDRTLIAAAGAFLHGMAGQHAEQEKDQLSVIATDLLNYVRTRA